MSFNPPPGMLQGEQVMASASGVDFSCVLGHVGTFKARGELFVTNIRLLFVAKEQQRLNGQVFGAFDIPLRAILDVRFNQPILFAPNLEGRATPVNCLGVTEPFSWKAAFKEGGTTQFVHSFLRLMDALARSQHQQQPPPPQQHQQPTYAPQPPMWQPTVPTAVPVADLASSYTTPHPPPPPTTPAYTHPPPPSYAPHAHTQPMPPPASAYVDPLQPSVVLVGEGGADPMAQASAPPGPGQYEKGRW